MDRFGRNIMWLSLFAVAIIATVGAWGGNGNGGPGADVVAAAPAATGNEVVVELRNMRFDPEEIRVAPGTTIVFVNVDPMEHNVVQATAAGLLAGDPEMFRSPVLAPGEEFRYTFEEEGVIPILCDVGGHYWAGMVATVVVTEDAAASDAVEAVALPGAGVRIAKDPTDMPPPITRTEPATVVVELETIELEAELADGITTTFWTFNGTVPGPMIRVREGDTVELRLRNHESSTQVHSIDLHAVTGPGGGAAVTQVAPGEEKAFRFEALKPGVYVYHCATPYIPMHVALGMYGLIVVDPAEGLPEVDHEFYIMQGDLYTDLRPGQKGHANYDGEAMWNELPNFVVFNGQYQALTGEHTMRAEVGDTIRLWVGNGGPNLISSFHAIGEIFDVVYPEGAMEAATNVQTTLIPAGGATRIEFQVDVPGTYVLVDHALNRALGKGAVATIEVTGPENPQIFEALY